MQMAMVIVMRMVVHREEQTMIMDLVIKMMSSLLVSQPLLLPALLNIRPSRVKLATLQLLVSLRLLTHLLSPHLQQRLHPTSLP